MDRNEGARAVPPAIAKPGFALPHSRYLRLLFVLLLSATVFEGYDITIFHLCTPDIARTFGLDDAAIGLIASIIRTGGILSFALVTTADLIGRKPSITLAVALYALFTLATALSSGMLTFTAFQSVAQLFLAAEFGIAVTMIGEEFPDELRGRAISWLHTGAFLGVAGAGLLYGYFAESSWGWRGMYLLGVAPLLLTVGFRRRLRETERFKALSGGEAVRPLVWLRRALREFTGPYRSRFILVSLLWNSIGVVGGPMITFFSLYAQREHGWTPGQVGFALVIAYFGGSLMSLAAGWSVDNTGRRVTAAVLYVIAGAAVAVLFRAAEYRALFLAEVIAMASYQGARTATSAIATELFPTEIRATGFSLAVQVVGQIGWTVSPLLVGVLARPLGGLGNAAALFAVGPLIGAVIVLRFIPETLGKTLEELTIPQAADL